MQHIEVGMLNQLDMDVQVDEDESANNETDVDNSVVIKPRKKTGRPQSTVWDQYSMVFVLGKNGGTIKRGECKLCKMQVSSKAYRLKEHLLKCKAVPSNSTNATPAKIDNDLRLTPASVKTVKRTGGQIGRKHSTIWNHYSTVTMNNEAGTSWKQSNCLTCNQTVSAKVNRLRAHLQKCNPAAAAADEVAQATASVSESITCTPELLSKARTQLMQRGTGLNNSSTAVKWLKPADKLKVDKQVGRFLFASNLSFTAVEHPEFQKLISMLHPNYQPPSSEVIGTTVLNSVYEEIQEKIKTDVSNKPAVLIQEGLSSTNNQNFPPASILSHLIHTGEHSFIFNSIKPESGVNERTAEYCANHALQAINESEEKYGVKVVGLVTDSCNAMESMRWIIQSVKPDMIIYGCNAHLLNLVGERMTSEEIVDRVIKVQEFFCNYQYNAAELKRLQGERPIIPKDNRWSSQIECLKSFAKNQRLYMDIERNAINERIEIDEEVRQLIEDPHTFYDVQRLITVLEPASIALHNLQQEKATIADSVEQWLDLVNNPVYNDAQRQLISHEMKNGLTPIAIAAFMLHPSKRGKGLDPQTEEIGRQWLGTKDGTFVCMATYLKHADTTVFPQSFLETRVSEAMKPHLWWLGLKGWPGIPQTLIDLAMNLMILPASTLSVDHCFNTVGLKMAEMHTKIGVEDATKLCSITRYLKGTVVTTW